MGNLKKRTIACPGTCMDNDACKQTKLVYCYNMRKIQTTKKVAHFWERTPPPQWFPWPLHAWKTITQSRFKSSTIARIQRNYNTEQLLGYLGKPSLGKIQTRSVARLCGASIQGKHNIHYSTTTRMKGKHKLQLLKLQCGHICRGTLLSVYFMTLSRFVMAFCLHTHNGLYHFVAEDALH